MKSKSALVVILLMTGNAAALAGDIRGGNLYSLGPTPLRPHDQLWVINCRGVVHQPPDDNLARLRHSVYRTATGWSPATRDDFHSAAQTEAVTCVLVLGNGYTSAETQLMGQKAYRRLVAGLPVDRAVRFVVWSWPSDHADTGPIKDLRIKAGRTWQVARWLACWLDDAQPRGAVSLLGTSFGARIVMESLELRAAVAVDEPPPEAASPVARPAFNVVLVSAAIDNDWLLPGRQLDMALSQVDRLLLVNNSSDRVLKRYHWLYGRRSKATALGSAGLPDNLPSLGEKVAQFDAAPIIGRQHGCSAYFDSPSLVGLMRDCLFAPGAPNEPTETPPALEIPSPEGAAIPLASGAAATSK